MRTQSTEARQQRAQTRGERERVLRPLFAYMVGRGMRRAWLAQQLGISRALLWNYERGVNRMPADFIETACRIVGIPSSLIPIPEPRSLYIQQPRQSKTTERTERQDDPQQPQRRVRRTQPTATTPATHHAPRHGATPNGSGSRSSSDNASPASRGSARANAIAGTGRRVARSRHRTSVGSGLAVTGQP